MKQTLAIDFDGVIHKYSKGWQGGIIYDDPVDGAKESIFQLMNMYEVVIFTSRGDLNAVRAWLESKFDFESKGFKVPEITNQKPIAIAYIDDRGIRFTDWDSTLKFLENMEIPIK